MLRGSDTRLARYFTRYLIDVARYRAYLNNGIYPRLKYRVPLDNLIATAIGIGFPPALASSLRTNMRYIFFQRAKSPSPENIRYAISVARERERERERLLDQGRVKEKH